MLRKPDRVVFHTRADPPRLLPPNPRDWGTLNFTPQDRAVLSALLADDGWPRATMDMAMLEGYLVALLVWPVGVQPGTWLPPIWGQTGWKVPSIISSPCAYAEFIELVVGFLQELDRKLGALPPDVAAILSQREPYAPGRSEPSARWAQGFLKALQLGVHGLEWRSSSARSAVTHIARHASAAATPTAVLPVRIEELTAAVLTLAAERSSRGPLGALPPSGSARVVARADGGRH